jgi:hypothetical protein
LLFQVLPHQDERLSVSQKYPQDSLLFRRQLLGYQFLSG